MKHAWVMEKFYIKALRVLHELSIFIRYIVFYLAPLHRIRDENGRFLGIVLMRPSIHSCPTGKFCMIEWLWIGDFS